MAYEVIYWNMPLCQAQCLVNDITGGQSGGRGQLSFDRSLSCTSSSLEDDEDAVWPGLRRPVDPDLILEHRPRYSASNQEVASSLNSSCCSLDVDVDLGDTFDLQEVIIML